jgi:hypothetical protein
VEANTFAMRKQHPETNDLYTSYHIGCCVLRRHRPGWLPMRITDLPATRFDLPGAAEPVYIATQQWALEPWEGVDPPELSLTWARKGKFAVNGHRSCAELAIVHHLRDDGWDGVWVSAYGPGSCGRNGSQPRRLRLSPKLARPSGPLRSLIVCGRRTGGNSMASSMYSPGVHLAKSGSTRQKLVGGIRSGPVGADLSSWR